MRKGERVGRSFLQISPPISHEFRLRLLCIRNTLYHGCSTCALPKTTSDVQIIPPTCARNPHTSIEGERKKKFEVQDLRFSQGWLWGLAIFCGSDAVYIGRNLGRSRRIKSWNVGITFLRNVGTFMPPYTASLSMRWLSYFGVYMTSEYILTKLMTVVDLVIRTWRDSNTGRSFYHRLEHCCFMSFILYFCFLQN